MYIVLSDIDSYIPFRMIRLWKMESFGWRSIFICFCNPINIPCSEMTKKKFGGGGSGIFNTCFYLGARKAFGGAKWIPATIIQGWSLAQFLPLKCPSSNLEFPIQIFFLKNEGRNFLGTAIWTAVFKIQNFGFLPLQDSMF